MKWNRNLRLNRLIVLATLLILLALGLGQPAIVEAQSCSNASLNGTYGYVIGGFLLPNREGVPLSSALIGASNGIETFDGIGNTSISETFVAALGMFPQTLSGTYSINPNCTGSATVTFADGFKATASLIVVDGGKEIEFLNTWQYVVEFGSSKKQDIAQGGCTNAMLNGTYGYVLEGFFLPNQGVRLGGTLIGASNGIETFDGNGNTSGSETVNISGDTHQQSYTGTYSVNPDCTGSITLDLANGSKRTGTISIVNGGREIEVAKRASTVVEFGSLKKL
jgi:hypothetical protein